MKRARQLEILHTTPRQSREYLASLRALARQPHNLRSRYPPVVAELHRFDPARDAPVRHRAPMQLQKSSNLPHGP